jgi:outer membrane protein
MTRRVPKLSMSPVIRGLASAATLGAALLATAPAHAAAGDFLVRGRFIMVAPQDGSGGITPAFPNDGVSVDTAYAPEIDFTYMDTTAG